MDGIPSLKIKTPHIPRIVYRYNCVIARVHSITKSTSGSHQWMDGVRSAPCHKTCQWGGSFRETTRRTMPFGYVTLLITLYSMFFPSIFAFISRLFAFLLIFGWRFFHALSFFFFLLSDVYLFVQHTNPVNSFFIYVFTRNINFIQNPKRITQVYNYRTIIANNLLHLYSSSFESFEAF